MYSPKFKVTEDILINTESQKLNNMKKKTKVSPDYEGIFQQETSYNA